MKVKQIQIKGENRFITLDKFNELVEKKVEFKDMGNRDL